MAEISTKPYLLRAIYEWCTDNGYTPFLAVAVDAATQVPKQFVRDGQIVLNISHSATKALKMDNEAIHFSARFGGVARDIYIPVDNVIAIYASENGQGMAFDAPQIRDKQPETANADAPFLQSVSPVEGEGQKEQPSDTTEPPKGGGKPGLKIVK